MNNQTVSIRRAVSTDINKLAKLHVTTWNATYPDELHKPTYEIREYQWAQAFADESNWFCFVASNPNDELIGFAKGKIETDGSGNLNKLYLSTDYHGQGIGRRLLTTVAEKFRSLGITRMWVVAETTNPTCAFYARMGGVRKVNNDPGVSVFVWRDLDAVDEGLVKVAEGSSVRPSPKMAEPGAAVDPPKAAGH